MSSIPESEISFSEISLIDSVGRLFFWRDKIYRGIYPEAAENVRQLFASGCLDELTRQNLFPSSRISAHSLRGFSFVVEHELIPVVTYPHEWSFDMFRDAALVILKVVETAARFGWDIQDCGPYNVLFRNSVPLYVDLGSFRPKPKPRIFDKGPDLVRLFWRPLAIWSSGDSFLAQRIISSAHVMMPDVSWWHYRHPLLRRLGRPLNARLARLSAKWWRRVARWLGHGRALAWLSPSLATRLLPIEITTRSPDLLRHSLAGLRPPASSPWADYHSEYLHDGEFRSTPRFDRIVEIVRSLDCASAVELAGNQGLLALLLARQTGLKKIICTDSSESAINRFYLYCRAHALELESHEIQAAVLDFMLPKTASRLALPARRFRSDVVLALAVTHHLLLTQNFPISDVLGAIASYTRRHALIEFMPLGLWDGTRPPLIPEWYTQSRFEHAFAEYFDIDRVEKLEANRILYVGRLKNSIPVRRRESTRHAELAYL